MNRLALALLAVAALVVTTDSYNASTSVVSGTYGRESRQLVTPSDIFSSPALGIGKPSGAKRRSGGSIKYKKVSVKTAAATAAAATFDTVPSPGADSTAAKTNKTRRLKPKSSNRHTMIYKPNKKTSLANSEEEKTTTTTAKAELSTTTLRSTTKPTKSYTTTTTAKPVDSYATAEPADTFVRPTKRVRLRVTKPPGESAQTTSGSVKGEKKPTVDPLRPIVRARISTTTEKAPAVPTTKFTRPTRKPTKPQEVSAPISSSVESYENGYDFHEDDGKPTDTHPIRSEEYQSSYEVMSTARPRTPAPEREPEPPVYKAREPERPLNQPQYDDDEPTVIRLKVPESDDEVDLYPRPQSFGFGARLPSKTSAEAGVEPNSGVRHEERGKNPGQQYKASGEYIRIQAKPEVEPPPRERPEDQKIKPPPVYYEQHEMIPGGEGAIPSAYTSRPHHNEPSEHHGDDERYTPERYPSYYSSTTYPPHREPPVEEEELPYRIRYSHYPIPPVTYEPPHLDYSPPSPPQPPRVYRPPFREYSPPSAYHPRPAEVEDIYRFSPSGHPRDRPEHSQSDNSRGKPAHLRLVGPQEQINRPQHYRPRPQEHDTSNAYRPSIDPLAKEEPTRYRQDQRNEVKHYRGHVAEVDAVRGLAPAFETFTRLVSIGQPTASDLPYPPPSEHERLKYADESARQPLQDQKPGFRQELPSSGRPGQYVISEPEKLIKPEYHHTRDDLRILETVLVGSPVTSTTPRAEARPIAATERPLSRVPGESHFRVLESAVISNNRGRGQSELPPTKLRPPSEEKPEGSYIPIPLNGRDQILWHTSPVREYLDEKPIQDRPLLQSYTKSHSQGSLVQQGYQSVKLNNNPPYSHYNPLDSPFTRPNLSLRQHEGRNGRLIPSLDTITDIPESAEYRPTEQPQLDYVRYETTETNYPREYSQRRPKELAVYREHVQKVVSDDTKPEYSFKVTYRPKDSIPKTVVEDSPGYLYKDYHESQDQLAITYTEKRPEYFPEYDYKIKDSLTDFDYQLKSSAANANQKPNYSPHKSSYSPTNPLLEDYVAQKQKHLQEEKYQAKEPFPEAFAEPKPEFLQAVIFETKDPSRDVATTTIMPDSQLAALEEGAAVKGIPGVDYPVYTSIPSTLSFKCEYVETTGYYADLETRCQVFHVCQPNNIKSSFLCPNGTIFNQKVRVCDWWHNVQCGDAPSYYHVNNEKEQERELVNIY